LDFRRSRRRIALVHDCLYLPVHLVGELKRISRMRGYQGEVERFVNPEFRQIEQSGSLFSGKIFIDYFRNDYTATTVADYGVRSRPGAPVAVPLAWEELKGRKFASAFTTAGGKQGSEDPGTDRQTCSGPIRAVNQMHRGRDAREPRGLEAGLICNQVCSLHGRWRALQSR
jgi:hypothetical protein